MDSDGGTLSRLERWLEQPPARSGWRGGARTAVRVVWGVAADIANGSIGRHAASLSYTTLLSLVPILALSFSVLKGLGAENTLMPMLKELLRPLGDSADPIYEFIWGFVGRVEASVLGAVGLAVLAYTAISVIQKIEDAFNELWQVSEPRSWGRRFTDYLSVLLVGPLLAAGAIGVIARLRDRAAGDELASYPPLQHAVQEAFALLPFAMLIVAFAGLYAFLPNTRVKALPAIGAAVAASLAWLAAAWAFSSFVAASASYTAIYSAFAALVLFLIWLNVNWVIVLIGADLAYYLQHWQRLKRPRPPLLPPAAVERLGLSLLAEIVRRQYAALPPPTAEELARAVKQPVAAIEPSLAALIAAGLLARSDQQPPRHILVRPPETTSVATALVALRGDGQADAAASAAVEMAAMAVTGAVTAGTAAWTLKALAGAGQPPPDAGGWIDDALR
jgi:membrane protein